MTRKGLALSAALALGLTAGTGASAAQAAKAPKPKFEHKQKLKSAAKTAAVCVSPTTTPVEGEASPVDEAHCRKYLAHAYAVGKPGKPAGPWSTSIKGASWLSFTPTAESAFNETSPASYIYETDFTAACPKGFAAVEVNGQMMGDDAVSARLNGYELPGEGSFGAPAPFSTNAPSTFVNGTNKLQFFVPDTGGWTGADYAATVGWTCA